MEIRALQSQGLCCCVPVPSMSMKTRNQQIPLEETHLFMPASHRCPLFSAHNYGISYQSSIWTSV
jgi:hypothetical protein